MGARVLFNFEPAATEEEIRTATLQYVRKVSGYAKPWAASEAARERARRRFGDVGAAE